MDQLETAIYIYVCRFCFNVVPSCCKKNTGKTLCYTRMVYMPMSYLYGKRFVGPLTPLIMLLRKELHLQPYEEINWNKARRLCAKVWLTNFSMQISLLWEKIHRHYIIFNLSGRHDLSSSSGSRFVMGHSSQFCGAYPYKLAVKKTCTGKGSSSGNGTHTL